MDGVNKIIVLMTIKADIVKEDCYIVLNSIFIKEKIV
jgi:hypothetical protein